MQTTLPFPPHHRWDRSFFLAMAGIAWLAILAGFGPELFEHASGGPPFPSALVLLHGAAFFAWLGLFTAQVWLIRSRRVAVHRTLGLAGVALVPTMVVLGLVAGVVSQRAHLAAGRPDLDFLILLITDMIEFGALAGAGLLLRRRAAAHKRLMLLATLCLLDAGFGRWFGDRLFAAVGDGFFGFIVELYAALDLVIVIAMLYDRATRGRVHPVYWIAFPLMLANQLVTSAIYHAPGWIPIARALVG